MELALGWILFSIIPAVIASGKVKGDVGRLKRISLDRLVWWE